MDAPIIYDDPDAKGAALTPPAMLPVLDEAGEVVKRADALPADFPPNAKPVGDGSYMLHLDYPVTWKERDAQGVVSEIRHTTLHLKRLKGKQQSEIARAVGQDHYRAQVIASSSGMSLGRAELFHDNMDASDIAAALRVVAFFIAPGRRTQP